MHRSITVAIVTRNRAKDLQECLQSLTLQIVRPDNILVVNNASSDDTSDIVKCFTKHFTIREIIEKQKGYPPLRNRALREAKTRWIVFIDDDCVVEKHWYREVIKATRNFVGFAALFGPSANFYGTNPYASAFQFSNEWRRLQSIHGKNVVDYRALDSRNIVYNRQVLIKKNIRFDGAFISGAEDGDMGLQIRQKRLKATFVKNMLVYHKEPRSYRHYWRKKYVYFLTQVQLDNKWGHAHHPIDKADQIALMRQSFRKSTGDLSFPCKLLSFCLITLDICFSKFRIYAFTEFFICHAKRILNTPLFSYG